MANPYNIYHICYLQTNKSTACMDVGTISCLLHVSVDIFNSYGTQALRPITNKWIQLGVINTFDPIIFIILVIGIILWIIGIHPYAIFIPILFLLIGYYMIRFKMQSIITEQALNQIRSKQHPVKIFVIPTLKFLNGE